MKSIKKLESFKAKYIVGLAIYMILAFISYRIDFAFSMIIMLYLAAMSLSLLIIDRNFNYAVVEESTGKIIREFESESDAIEFADDCNKDVKVVNLFTK